MEIQKTTITISNELWKHIIDNKNNPRETHEEVIWRLIKKKWRRGC